MAFNQKTWYVKDESGNVPEGAPTINAVNLNRIEAGIANNDRVCEANSQNIEYLRKSIPISPYLAFVGKVNTDMVSAAFGKGNEDDLLGVGKALSMYAKFKEETTPTEFMEEYDSYKDLVLSHKYDLVNVPSVCELIRSNSYAYDILMNTVAGLPDIVIYDSGSTNYLDLNNITKSVSSSASCVEGKDYTCSVIPMDKCIQFNLGTRQSYQAAAQFTIPITNMLPSIKGYRYLNVKLSDDVDSFIVAEYSGGDTYINLEFNGVNHELYSASVRTDITGNNINKDVFDSNLTNSSLAYIKIIFRGSRSSNQSDTIVDVAKMSIEKIWLSEN